MSPLARLIERGDKVEILKGRLSITPKSGLPIPGQWLKEHTQSIVLDMTSLTDQLYLTYTGFDCGYYGQHKAGGLNIHLSNMTNHRACYTIFNVGLKRTRKSKTGEAGARLPKGQFSVTKKQGFYLFWLATGLKMPDRANSRLWGYMGNLASLHFTGNCDPTDTKQEKILTRTLKVLNISYETLLDSGEFIHTACTGHSQAIHTTYTSAIHKKMDKGQQSQDTQPVSTTGNNNHGRRLKGKEVNGKPHSPPASPKNQSVDEWLAEYETPPIGSLQSR